jgi:chorismate-pyruvate lyase
MMNLNEIKKELGLEPIQLMLLAHTGSMTVLLQALFGEIKLETELQEIIAAQGEVAKILEISEGEPTNHRIVRLKCDRNLVRAESFAPISRLEKGFKNDVMRKDTPIGKIMAKHGLESRREILGFSWFFADKKFSDSFDIALNSIVLRRNYNIIHKEKPLINISEVFPMELGGW